MYSLKDDSCQLRSLNTPPSNFLTIKTQEHKLKWRKCRHCGQLILGKISKTGATTCQTFLLKCTEFDFRWGSDPDLAGGPYTVSPDSIPCSCIFEGLLLKGRRRKGGEGKAGEVWLPPIIVYSGSGSGRGEGRGNGKEGSFDWAVYALLFFHF